MKSRDVKPEKHYTLAQARAALAGLGITIKKDTVGSGPTGSGEYRVNYRGGDEDSAYYTSYIDDAVQTGQAMAKTVREFNATAKNTRIEIRPIKGKVS